jgi:hypothetical protein
LTAHPCSRRAHVECPCVAPTSSGTASAEYSPSQPRRWCLRWPHRLVTKRGQNRQHGSHNAEGHASDQLRRAWAGNPRRLNRRRRRGWCRQPLHADDGQGSRGQGESRRLRLPYHLLRVGACVGAALGCYVALRLIGHGLVSTSAILLALLTVPGLLAAIRTHSAPGWPSAWEWAFGFVIFVVLPLLSPAIASLLAEALTRRSASA